MAADEIVTEAETPAFAPEVSSRPQTRPSRPEPVAEPEPEATETASNSGADAEAEVDPVAAALAEATAAASTPAATQGLAGGDLSDGQKADLRREIGGCWSVGSASTAALSTLITVEWVMEPNGSVDTGSIEMVGFEGGSQADANVAFRIARSAIVRCQNDGGRSGYSLPPEEFNEARRFRVTFDPSQMRLR